MAWLGQLIGGLMDGQVQTVEREGSHIHCAHTVEGHLLLLLVIALD